jgi:hypothetical protein
MGPYTRRAILGILSLVGLAAWLVVMFGTMQARPRTSAGAQLRDEQRRVRVVREVGVESGAGTRTGEGAIEALVGFDKPTNGFTPQQPNR